MRTRESSEEKGNPSHPLAPPHVAASLALAPKSDSNCIAEDQGKTVFAWKVVWGLILKENHRQIIRQS